MYIVVIYCFSSRHELEEIQEREAEKSKYIQHRKLELAAQHRKAATRHVEIFESRFILLNMRLHRV